jgi:hypothetical protein
MITDKLKVLLEYQTAGNDLILSHRELHSLGNADIPDHVEGSFICSFNDLIDLKGGPEKVDKDYFCSNNKLVTLKGAPKHVPGEFSCFGNKLINLRYGPEKVDGDYNCSNNKIENLDGIAKEIGGNFRCFHNPGKFTEEDVRKQSNIKGKVLL